MKDEMIRVRVTAEEKERVEKDSWRAGFDNVSAYVLSLLRKHRPRSQTKQ